MKFLNLPTTLNFRTLTLVLAILFAAATLWDFGLPGFYVDEANDYAFIPGILSEDAARLHHYRLWDNYFDYQDKLSRFPIVGGSLYNSSIRPYLSLPYFLFAGLSIEALRIFVALTAFAATLAASGLAGRVFGWRAALIAGLIVVSDPISTFLMRSQGGLMWFVVFFISMAGHALLSASGKEKSSILLAIGAGTSISLAVSSYFVGAFFAFPLIALALWIYRRNLLHFVALLASGLVAYSPIIYAMVSIYLKTPKQLENFGMPGFALKNQTPTFSWANVERVFEVIRGSFGTYDFAKGVVGNFSPDWSAIRGTALAASLITIAVVTITRNAAGKQTKVFYAVGGAAIGLYLLAAFFLKSFSLHHMVPIAILVFLLTSSLTVERGKFNKVGWIACTILLTTNLVSLGSAHSQLRRTGGLAFHNEMVSETASMFRTTLKEYHPIFASWGFHLQYLFLTEGKSPYTFMTKPNRDKIQHAMDKHGASAIVVWKDHREQVLKDFTPAQEFFFTQRDGAPLYSVMLLPEGTRESPVANALSKIESTSLEFTSGKKNSPSKFSVTVDRAVLCRGAAAVAKVNWDASVASITHLQIFISSETERGKKLWIATPSQKGSEQTGEWVQPGMRFFFMDGGTDRLLDAITVDAEACA